MRKTLWIVLGSTVAFLLVSVVVFRIALDLNWLDAAYFAITTYTSVGYGDIHLLDAPPGVKLFGMLLMLAGAASMAVIFAIVADSLLRLRLEAVFGRRTRTMKDHTILCGLGNVGMRILEQLHRMNEAVVVIEKSEDCEFVDVARRMEIPVVIGDVRHQNVLEEAGVQSARCLVAATDRDLANLEAALNARSVRPEIQIVLRIFDHNLAKKIKEGFDIRAAFSTSALAAPAFAMAAVDPSVVGSFFVGEDLMLNVDITVEDGTRLAWMKSRDFMEEGRFVILAHECGKTGERSLNPSHDIQIAPGDHLVIACPREDLATLHTLNRPVAGTDKPA